jgi:hypothetical protein
MVSCVGLQRLFGSKVRCFMVIMPAVDLRRGRNGGPLGLNASVDVLCASLGQQVGQARYVILPPRAGARRRVGRPRRLKLRRRL